MASPIALLSLIIDFSALKKGLVCFDRRSKKRLSLAWTMFVLKDSFESRYIIAVIMRRGVFTNSFPNKALGTSWHVFNTRIDFIIFRGKQVGELHKGPLKRRHGLLKRLVRLSHLWLNEYTTWAAFQEKLKILLWDYIVRNVKPMLPTIFE